MQEDIARVLGTTMPFAVELRIANMLRLPPGTLPTWEDGIKCPECKGAANGCDVCGDHATVRRADGLALCLAKHEADLYGGGECGAAAKAFNMLAEILALLAFQPGGVEFMGQTFVADPAVCYPILRPAIPPIQKVRKV
jgi:hypothetical protein